MAGCLENSLRQQVPDLTNRFKLFNVKKNGHLLRCLIQVTFIYMMESSGISWQDLLKISLEKVLKAKV